MFEIIGADIFYEGIAVAYITYLTDNYLLM